MLLRQPAAPAAAPPDAMPVDVRLMNAIAAAVFALAVAAALALGAKWVARLPQFAFRGVRLEGDLQRNSAATVRADALSRLKGNFFTMDLTRARGSFEQVPWVRRAVVRRVWPDRLVVSLEEHQPVALWSGDENSDKMVNTYGEVFEANVGDVEDEGLPEFEGPEGSSAQVLAMYRRLLPVFRRMDAEVSSLALSGRGSWKAELDGGAAV
ncbi:MAG: FtsQ-type POTRA domain-containing protein, partial [Burkholderiaceae bacterium]